MMSNVHFYITDSVITAGDQGALDDVFALLPGRETVRSHVPNSVYTVVTMDMPDAPPGAAVMVPWINTAEDGTITLGTIEYLDSDGQRLLDTQS